MIFLQLLVLAFVLGWLFGRRDSKPANQVDSGLSRQQFLTDFINGFKAQATTKAAKKLIDDMLKAASGFATPQAPPKQPTPQPTQPPATNIFDKPIQPNLPKTAPLASAPAPSQAIQKPAKDPIDNTSLLLYFGAFLFITSMGLFVGFSNVGGSIKTFSIAIVCLSLYFGGIYLHENRKQFKQVGIAFTAIGMAIAPLIGLAAYNYVFDQSNGPVVWFMTSLGVFLMYLHTLFTLRNTIVSYLLIVTFVSLFESAVSVIDAPIHYFAWALAIAGMILQVISLNVKSWPELKGSTGNSAMILIAMTLVVSIFMVESNGLGQLCVSLALSTIFATVELFSNKKQQIQNAIAVQVLGTMTVGLSVYYLSDDKLDVAIGSLAILTLAEAALVVVYREANKLMSTLTTVSMFLAWPAIILALSQGGLLIVALGAALVLHAAIAYFHKRVDAFIFASLIWGSIPIIYGQVVAATDLTAYQQAAVSFIAALPNALILADLYLDKSSRSWLDAAKAMFMSVSILAIVVSLFGDTNLTTYVSLGVAGLFGVMGFIGREKEWAFLAGLAPFAAVVSGLQNVDERSFLIATGAALAVNIGLSLAFRTSPNRWLSTIAWLILPMSLGFGALEEDWTFERFAWAYVVIMLVLVVSRTIARGMILFSSNVLMSSLTKGASEAYVIGAVFAGILAYLLSFGSDNVALTASLIAGVVGVSMTWTFHVVEKQAKAGLIMPFVVQLILMSLLEAFSLEPNVELYVGLSAAAALIGYAWSFAEENHNEFMKNFFMASLVVSCVAPLSAILITTRETVWLHPASLILAGALTLNYVWAKSQALRELAGGVMMIGVFWAMAFAGVENLQAYSHVLALLFVSYAYWRWEKGDKSAVESYIYAALTTTTVPLVGQALFSDSGGLYGIWLLLEMIGIMLVGITFKNRLATMWGLYVAIGAVLYQLRDLGWAMLAVLSIFVIGVAIYRTMRQSDD